MPKKTRKHKIKAQQRRTFPTPTVTKRESSRDLSPHEEPAPVSPKITKMPETDLSSRHFKSDFLKSVMITLVLISIEVGIFIGTVTGTFDIRSLLHL